MERSIPFRRPIPSKSEGLSRTARTFFGLNLFQVFVIGGIQGAMIIVGDFSSVSVGGLGPGRRIYMVLFLGAILYSCLLCLFAVKKQNYLEILAFVFQNYAYIVYSCIQVYHISFKKYKDHLLKRQINLVYLTIIDSIGLLILNFIFTYLAVKLYGEYGWKIYKRVRFNVKLRAAFHLYETVIMLVKMVVLFVAMYSICYTQTILRGQYTNASFIMSMVFIPLSLLWAIFGIFSIRKENRPMAYIYILGVAAVFVYFNFKIIRIATKTCIGCPRFEKQTEDIPGEVDLHLLYLSSTGSLFIFLLLLASIKAVKNFGIGLAAHFNETSTTMIVLNLSKNIFTSIVPSSTEDRVCVDIESPRPSISNEPRPSIFQFLPNLRSVNTESDNQGKGLTLPAQVQKRDKTNKPVSSSTKNRITQLFWEREIGNLSRSQQSSFSSERSASCFKDCCPWLQQRSQLHSSTYGVNGPRSCGEGATCEVVENSVVNEKEVALAVKNNVSSIRRTLSCELHVDRKEGGLQRPRFNSLPSVDCLFRNAEIYENKNADMIISASCDQEITNREIFQCAEDDEKRTQKDDSCCFGEDNAEAICNYATENCTCSGKSASYQRREANNQSGETASSSKINTHAPLRRIKSSISSISSMKTESSDYEFDNSDEDTDMPSSFTESKVIVRNFPKPDMISTFIHSEVGKDILSPHNENGQRKAQTISAKSQSAKERFPGKENGNCKIENRPKSKIPALKSQNSSKTNRVKVRATAGATERQATEKQNSLKQGSEMSKTKFQGQRKVVQKIEPNKVQKAKPAPNFDKIHQKWGDKLQKGKELKKKPSTQVDAFKFEKKITTDDNETFGINPVKFKSGMSQEIQPRKAFVKTNISNDFKDFQPDACSLKEILEGTTVNKTPLRSDSMLGPIKRMTFGGFARRDPHKLTKENRASIYYKENYDRNNQLSLKEQLAEILNTCSRKAPALSSSATTTTSPASTTITQQQVEGNQSLSSNRDMPCTPRIASQTATSIYGGMPKPRMPGQLCEVNYISPRKCNNKSPFYKSPVSQPLDHQRSVPGMKSPSRSGAATPVVENLFTTPLRRTPQSRTPNRKTPSAIKLALPARLTDEAIRHRRQGLPLPKQPYEYLDVSKQKSAKKAWEDANNHDKQTENGGCVNGKAGVRSPNGVDECGSKKKSVRWADVFDNEKTSAKVNKELLFTSQVSKPSSSNKENVVIKNNSNVSAMEISLVEKILQKIEKRKEEEHEFLNSGTTVTNSILKPRMSHMTSATNHQAQIPKPFLGHDVMNQIRKITMNENHDWNDVTPEDEARDKKSQSLVPQGGLTKISTTPRVDQTPQFEMNLRAVPNGPYFRRTWARTPYSELKKRKENEEISSDSTLEQPTEEANLKRSVDTEKTRNILLILNDVNEMSISDDLKKVRSRKEFVSSENSSVDHPSKDLATFVAARKHNNIEKRLETAQDRQSMHPMNALNSDKSDVDAALKARLVLKPHQTSLIDKQPSKHPMQDGMVKSAFRKISPSSSGRSTPDMQPKSILSNPFVQLSLELPTIDEICSQTSLDAEIAIYTKYHELSQKHGTKRLLKRDGSINPLARIITDGDDRYFIPISEEEAM
eukprot:gene3737-4259_t